LPAAQPSSTFVAVSAAPGADDAELTLSRRPERRAPSRRLRDAAVHSAYGTRALLFGALAVSVIMLAGCEWFFGGIVSVGWIVVALLITASCASALLLARRSSDTRRNGRRLSLVFGAMLGVLAIGPWTASTVAWPAGSYLVAFVIATMAVVGACGFAPLGWMAAAAAALPLSPAITALVYTQPALSALAAACVFASAMAGLLALSQHRRWLAEARTAIDQEDQVRTLEAARDAAIKADQEKSRFLAIASHDLRQPVHAIGLFAATLEKRLAGSAEEPLGRNLSHAIDGLDRSFNVMLDISRLDAGAIEPRVQHFPLRDLFRRLHMHFAGQAEQKGLGLRFSPGGKSISSDPQLLERIMGNLVQNAIKYTQRGGIVVVARSAAHHIHLEIWDTGVGIRSADLHRVFDEFYQVGRGERVRAQGLGMGLAIVKRLVRLLGHELTISSRPGKGTMFRLKIALGGLPEIQDVTAAADTLPMPLLLPRTVLVLDDEEPIREGLCMLLQEWGYDAIAAGSIEEATYAVANLDTPPDLILSDLHLGDGPDGIAGIEAIRRQCGCEVAAMLITGDTSHAEIRRATESGHPVLFKPVQPRKLYDALRGLAS
jgi:signal transduction histidine kinase/CheY-like chemotaxis protein